jgi:hypothetical protein
MTEKTENEKAYAIGRNVERRELIVLLEGLEKNALQGPAKGVLQHVLGILYRVGEFK